jgi:serine/threonine protein kinase
VRRIVPMFETRRDIEKKNSPITRLTKVWSSAREEHIVRLLGWGENLEVPSSFSSHYFFDMELCDLNLADYISPNVEWKGLSVIGHKSSHFNLESPAIDRATGIWIIMKSIACGLSFLHINDMVHCDLKPRNGDEHPENC